MRIDQQSQGVSYDIVKKAQIRPIHNDTNAFRRQMHCGDCNPGYDVVLAFSLGAVE